MSKKNWKRTKEQEKIEYRTLLHDKESMEYLIDRRSISLDPLFETPNIKCHSCKKFFFKKKILLNHSICIRCHVYLVSYTTHLIYEYSSHKFLKPCGEGEKPSGD